jgi:hypothetical protein
MVTWALMATFVLGAPALKELRKPAKAPAGEWAEVSIQRDGEGGPLSLSTNVRISPTAIDWGPPLSPPRAVAFFEPAGGPAEVDIDPGDPKNLQRGIWRLLDGDTLLLAVADRGAARPACFRTSAGSGHTLWVLKRVPKE